jgi:hypothetical protein
VIELKGYHYFNDDINAGGPSFVRETLLRNLHEMSVALPQFGTDTTTEVPLSDMGIGYPVMVYASRVSDPQPLGDPNHRGPLGPAPGARPGAPAGLPPVPGGGAPPPGEPGDAPPPVEMVRRCDFIVQFSWQPTPPSRRRELAKEREQSTTQPDGSVASADAQPDGSAGR